jgi:hypothetical protein
VHAARTDFCPVTVRECVFPAKLDAVAVWIVLASSTNQPEHSTNHTIRLASSSSYAVVCVCTYDLRININWLQPTLAPPASKTSNSTVSNFTNYYIHKESYAA